MTIQLKLYYIFKKDLHLPDDKTFELLRIIDDITKYSQKVNLRDIQDVSAKSRVKDFSVANYSTSILFWLTFSFTIIGLLLAMFNLIWRIWSK